MAFLNILFPKILKDKLWKFFLFTLFIITTPIIIFAQKKSDDATHDLEEILEICKKRSISNEELLELAKKGILIAKTQNDTLFEARFLVWQSIAERGLGRVEKSFEHVNTAHFLYQQINDSVGVITSLRRISELFMFQSEFEKSKHYIEQAIELTEKFKSPLLKYEIKLAQANIYYSQRNHPKALSLYNNLINFCHNNDLDSAQVLANSASILLNIGKTEVALDRMLKARKTFQIQGKLYDYNLAELHTGFILMESRFYPEAFEFFQRAHDAFLQKNEINLLGFTLENMGLLMLNQNKLTEAEKYIAESIVYMEKNGKNNLGDPNTLLGRVEFQKKNFERANDYFERAFEIYNAVGDVKGKGDVNNWLAKVWLKLEMNEKALVFAKNGLEINEANKTAKQIADSYYILAEIYESQQQFDLALQATKKMNEYKKQFQQPEKLVNMSRKLVSETLQKNDIPVITKISEPYASTKYVTLILIGVILTLGAIVFYLKTSNKKNINTHPSSINTPKKDYLKDVEAQQLLTQLTHCIQTKQPYLDEELTLNGLATQIGTTDKKLSALLNQHLNTSFYDYINILRVEAFKKEIEKEEYSHLSLIGVAFNCGFKSKSSFYRIFKKETGQSPSEYKKQFFTKK